MYPYYAGTCWSATRAVGGGGRHADVIFEEHLASGDRSFLQLLAADLGQPPLRSYRAMAHRALWRPRGDMIAWMTIYLLPILAKVVVVTVIYWASSQDHTDEFSKQRRILVRRALPAKAGKPFA
jgi:hypothetical protein